MRTQPHICNSTYNYKNVTLVPALNFKPMLKKGKKEKMKAPNSIFLKVFAVREKPPNPHTSYGVFTGGLDICLNLTYCHHDRGFMF